MCFRILLDLISDAHTRISFGFPDFRFRFPGFHPIARCPILENFREFGIAGFLDFKVSIYVAWDFACRISDSGDSVLFGHQRLARIFQT